MEYYSKGKNIEEPLEKQKIPIENLPSDITWIQVRGGSKIRNLLSYAFKEFTEDKPILWSGFGPAVGKTVSCAELMKRHYNNTLHQLTKISYYNIDEYWNPKIEELDSLVVQRKLPMIYILLSQLPLNTEDSSYQAPGITSTTNMENLQTKKNIEGKKKTQKKYDHRKKRSNSFKNKNSHQVSMS